MAAADRGDLERLIKSTGFFRAKAKNIKSLSQKILIDFKIDLHGYSLQESFEKIKGIVENCYQKDLRNILIAFH